MLVLFFFLLYMCLDSSFCLMGEGKRGIQMPFGAVQSNGVVAFGFRFFLFFFFDSDDAEMVQLCYLSCCAVSSWSLLMVRLDVR